MSHTTNHYIKLPHRLHFIGIGGAGMFPLVQILKAQGHHITGSDNNHSGNTAQEEALGIHIWYHHEESHVEGAEMVIYTNAIGTQNPEYLEAQRQNIPLMERAELLGMVTRIYKQSVCISGSHGKTTTTAMATQLFIAADLDPAAAVGGNVPTLGGNGRVGDGDIFACEACEFKDSFLQLTPYIGIILNIDNDHLDYFKTMENLTHSFHRFALSCTHAVIINGENPYCKEAVKGVSAKVVTFGMTEECDYYPQDIQWTGVTDGRFNLCHKGHVVCPLHIKTPGNHNILNAIAAAVSALLLGANPEKLTRGLEDFRGVSRRFDIIAVQDGITIADDFAHHPTEIAATVEAVMALNYKEVYIIFQPHTFSRTSLLFEAFITVLSKVPHLLITDIYSAREVNTYGIYSEDLVKRLENAVLTPTFQDACQYIQNHAQSGDLVMTMGGGDINKVTDLLLK